MIANAFVRRKAKAAGVALWQIARYLGVSEPTMTRRLRVELDDADRQVVLDAINALSVVEEGDDAKTEIQS